MRARFWTLPLVAAFLFAISSTASAVPTTSISGNNTFPIGPFGPSPTVTFGNGGVTSTAPVNIPGITGGGFTAGPFTTNGGPINLGGTLTLTFGGNNAVFQLPGQAQTFGWILTNNIIDTGTALGPGGSFLARLVSNATGIDLGPLNGLWQFQDTFNGIQSTAGSPGSFSLASGQTSSGSFTLNFISNPPNAPPVPEPTSLAIWGTMMAAGWMVRRRVVRS